MRELAQLGEFRELKENRKDFKNAISLLQQMLPGKFAEVAGPGCTTDPDDVKNDPVTQYLCPQLLDVSDPRNFLFGDFLKFAWLRSGLIKGIYREFDENFTRIS
jgi:hypothetical protein